MHKTIWFSQISVISRVMLLSLGLAGGAELAVRSPMALAARLPEELVASSLKDEGLAFDFYQRGEALYQQEDWDGAIEAFSRAISESPRSVNALVYRGHAYSQKGDYDRAIEDYDRALRIDPNHENARTFRASAIRLRQGRLGI